MGLGCAFFMRTLKSKIVLSLVGITCAFASLGLVGCSSDDKKSDTAEGSYAIALEYEKAERYDEAIRRYNETRNRFPYSKVAVEAELAVANCYFKQESFAEAQVSYNNFKDLHPKHSQIAYVTFRIAMSYYHQLPSTFDRDLTVAYSAIKYFDEVIRSFSTSEFAKESGEKRSATLKMLAEKEQYIADFYFRKEAYNSAFMRYENLLKLYPDLGFDARALMRAALCLARQGEQAQARDYLKKLSERFPGSSELTEAQKEVK